MSKILEKNSNWETVASYWKQFVGWVTDLRSKYWKDIFFRTGVNVITLQVFFSIILSILVAVSFNYLYKDILQTILTGIAENLKNSGTFTSKNIVDSIQAVRDKNFLSFFGIALSISLIFSYIIARMTLYPTRNALKSQKRFISDIAHELRTPISVIKTNSEVALLDDVDSRTRKIFRSNIEELDRISGIINNLLTFNTLVNPEQIKFSSVNMGEVVETALKKLDELIKQKEIKIVVKKVRPYTAKGNSIALEQIAINIIKNALNYNRPGGSITITLEPDYANNVIFRVEDTGVGISQHDLLHIFEPFYRAERSRNRQSGSSGLGLTIVSELVKLHSGRISVSSRLKEGTSVEIVLPYSRHDANDETTKKSTNEISVNFLKKA